MVVKSREPWRKKVKLFNQSVVPVSIQAKELEILQAFFVHFSLTHSEMNWSQVEEKRRKCHFNFPLRLPLTFVWLPSDKRQEKTFNCAFLQPNSNLDFSFACLEKCRMLKIEINLEKQSQSARSRRECQSRKIVS